VGVSQDGAIFFWLGEDGRPAVAIQAFLQRGGAWIHDFSSRWACFVIWGPRAREVVQPLTPQDLDNEAFPYMSLR
jgi:glycine cleavage system aminomethyltransferase T